MSSASLDLVRTLEHDADLTQEPFVVLGRDDLLILRGWAFDSATGTVPSVHARVAGKELPAAQGDARPDVGAIHGPAAANSGFVVAIPAALLDDVGDVSLIARTQQGLSAPFASRRVVVADGDPAERSGCVVLDAIDDAAGNGEPKHPLDGAAAFGTRLTFTGWAYVTDGLGERLPVVAVMVDGSRAYQASYRRPRPDVFAVRGVALDVGFTCDVSTVRIGPGMHDVRVRAFDEAGRSVESERSSEVAIESA